jgi:hypothetical protein
MWSTGVLACRPAFDGANPYRVVYLLERLEVGRRGRHHAITASGTMPRKGGEDHMKRSIHAKWLIAGPVVSEPCQVP